MQRRQVQNRDETRTVTWRRLWSDRSGATAMIFAVCLPLLGMLAAAGIELAFLASDRAKMQGVADSAALMGARAMAVTTHTGVVERAKAFAEGELTAIKNRSTVTINGEVNAETKTVTVRIESHRMSFFGDLLPPGGFRIGVRSSAIGMGAPLCVLTLQTKNDKSLNPKDSAVLSSGGCAVQSDSDIDVENSAKITAAAVRSVGPASGMITPAAQVGSQKIDDPFTALNLNEPLPCLIKLPTTNHKSGTTSLGPGVHCGKIEVGGGATLKLLPGAHYFMEELQVKEDSTLEGTDVVVILGKDAKLKIQDKAKLSLEGRKTGAFAGFVLATQRDMTNDVELVSENARKLLGTVYIPAAKLIVDGKDKVAEQSSWTVIVSKSLQIKGSATLVINSDYASSTVPVPSGVGSKSGLNTRLVN
jgi:Flp pilus assembly protein TadG